MAIHAQSIAQTGRLYIRAHDTWGETSILNKAVVVVVRIGSNISALGAQRRLADNSSALSKTFERLSSGRRINTAADDAAGLAVALKLNADSRVYTQGMRNLNDGISCLNIADSALEQLSGITTRQIELAQQAANGAYSFTQRKALTAEANALAKEFNRIVQSTEFNGRKILEVGSSGNELRIQSGYGSSGSVSFEVGSELARSVGSGNFSAGTDITWDPNLIIGATKLGDVNGDGICDVVAAGTDGSNGIAMVQFGDGNGSFTGAVSYTMDATECKTMALADLDQDGALDLITAGYDSFFGTMTVRLNDGAGNFSPGDTYLVPGAGYSGVPLAVADVTGDGALDLVASNFATVGQVVLFENDGHGSFASNGVYVGPGGSSLIDLSLGDADGDGDADLFLLEQQGLNSIIKVRLNDGSGAFSAFSALTISNNTSLTNLAVEDLNGDGALDIATAGLVSIYFNDGSGGFSVGASYTSANATNERVRLSDLNGDGAADLITGDYLWLSMESQVSVRLNDGSGAFSSAQTYSVYGSPTDRAPTIDVADINGDGAPDIAGSGGGIPYPTSLLFGVSRDITTVASLDMYSQGSARNALTSLQSQLTRISKERGAIGGSQSRLSVALDTLSATRENVEAAGSRITDADIAVETGQLVRLQILQQATSAVLAQANQQPALALRLLEGR